MGAQVQNRLEQILQATRWDTMQLAEYLGVSYRAVELWLKGLPANGTNESRILYLEEEITSGRFPDPQQGPFGSLIWVNKLKDLRRFLNMEPSHMAVLLRVQHYQELEDGRARPGRGLHKLVASASWKVRHHQWSAPQVVDWLERQREPEQVEDDLAEVTPAHTIRTVRRKLGMTQGELARKLEVDQSRISQYERGLSTVPPRILQAARDLLAPQTGPVAPPVAPPAAPPVSAPAAVPAPEARNFTVRQLRKVTDLYIRLTTQAPELLEELRGLDEPEMQLLRELLQ